MVATSAFLLLVSAAFATGDRVSMPMTTIMATPLPLTTQEMAQSILLTRVEHMPLNTFDLRVLTYVPHDFVWEIYSPDGNLRTAFSVPNSAPIVVTEQGRGKTIRTVEPDFIVTDVAFSFDNTQVVFTGTFPRTVSEYWTRPSPVVIYSLVTGEYWNINDTIPAARTASPAFSHNGAKLAFRMVGGDSCSRLWLSGPQIWDLTTGHPLDLILPFTATVFAFSPDDTRIALGDTRDTPCFRGTSGLAVLNLDSGEVVFQLDLNTIGVAFSPDDRYLLSVEDPSTLHLWDSHIGTPLGQFEIDPTLRVRDLYVRFDTDRIQVVAWTAEDDYLYSGEIPLP